MQPLLRRSSLLLAIATASLVRADVVETTWLGGAGSWHDASKWSAGVVPNNSSSTTFRVDIPSGSITRTDAGQATVNIAIDALTIRSAGTLRITTSTSYSFSVASSTLLVDGHLDAAGPLRLGANALLTGSGTISSFPFSGRIDSVSGGMTIDTGLTVDGFGGTIGNRDAPLTNRGHVVGQGNAFESPFTLAGSRINNLGTIDSPRATAFDGTFTRADLGNLVFAADTTYVIAGTLLNQGQTLSIDASHYWMLGGLQDGAVQGGTIDVAPGQVLYTPWNRSAKLDDVRLNGRYNFGGGLGPLTIVDGVLKGAADVVLSPSSLDGASRMVSGSGSLVVAAEAKVRGGGGILGVPTFPTSGIGPLTGGGVPVLNHGTIIADNPDGGGWTGDFDVIAPTLSNDGTVGVETGSRLRLTGDFINLSGGVVVVAMSAMPDHGLLLVDGQLRLDSTADALSLTTSPTIQPLVFYRIATAGGGVLGEFDSVTSGFEVMYSGNDIFARIVPEPAVLWSIVTGLLWIRRRRRGCQLSII